MSREAEERRKWPHVVRNARKSLGPRATIIATGEQALLSDSDSDSDSEIDYLPPPLIAPCAFIVAVAASNEHVDKLVIEHDINSIEATIRIPVQCVNSGIHIETGGDGSASIHDANGAFMKVVFIPVARGEKRHREEGGKK